MNGEILSWRSERNSPMPPWRGVEEEGASYVEQTLKNRNYNIKSEAQSSGFITRERERRLEEGRRHGGGERRWRRKRWRRWQWLLQQKKQKKKEVGKETGKKKKKRKGAKNYYNNWRKKIKKWLIIKKRN